MEHKEIFIKWMTSKGWTNIQEGLVGSRPTKSLWGSSPEDNSWQILPELTFDMVIKEMTRLQMEHGVEIAIYPNSCWTTNDRRKGKFYTDVQVFKADNRNLIINTINNSFLLAVADAALRIKEMFLTTSMVEKLSVREEKEDI